MSDADIVVCPLGPEPARTATLESLLALRAAPALYDGGLGPAGKKLLRSLGLRAARLPRRLPPGSCAVVFEGGLEFAKALPALAGRRARFICVPGAASRALAATGLILGNDAGRVEVLDAKPSARAAVLERHGAAALCVWTGKGRVRTVGEWAKKASGRGALLVGRRP